MDADIKEIVQKCEICQEYARSEQKETLLPHDLPYRPWQYVGSDLFELGKNTYLIIADYYSKMPFVRRLTNQTSHGVIAKLKTIFGEHGIPDAVFSDGGPCYASKEFAAFAKNWGFRHVTSSPRYPQSNGFIERIIQTVKRTLMKAAKANMDPELALLCVRSTPVAQTVGSPAQLLYNRVIKSNLPMREPGNENTMAEFKELQDRQKKYYDRSAKDLTALTPGQTVGVQNPQNLRWSTGYVINPCENEPRSYVVKCADGSVIRRNRRFLRDLPPVQSITRANTVHSDVPSIPANETDNVDVSSSEQRQSSEDAESSRRSKRNIKKPDRLIEKI